MFLGISVKEQGVWINIQSRKVRKRLTAHRFVADFPLFSEGLGIYLTMLSRARLSHRGTATLFAESFFSGWNCLLIAEMVLLESGRGEGRPAVGEGAVQVPTLSLRAVGLWGCHLLVSLGLGFLLCKIKILGGSFSPVWKFYEFLAVVTSTVLSPFRIWKEFSLCQVPRVFYLCV